MSVRYAVAAGTLALLAVLGGLRAVAQDATPDASPTADGEPTTLTLVERSEHVTTVDLGAPGASTGDLIVWGPDPLYDAANASDTGATAQGTCVALNAARDCLADETIVFPDGSTLQVQGVEPGAAVASERTIVAGSGRYLGATGTLTVEPSADRSTWTKTFAIRL